MNIEDMTNAELVQEHNKLAKAAGKPELKSWKGKKTLLLERILAFGVLKATKAKAEKVSKAKTKAKKLPAKSFRAPGLPKDSIRREALRLLAQVDFYEDRTKRPSDENRVSANNPNARSVGLSYPRIVEQIQDTFSDAQTSVACLRWYAVKARIEEEGYEGFKMPQRRPRA